MIPRAAQSGNETLRTYFCFVFSEAKCNNFDFRMNCLHNEVEWPIKPEFVIENPNIYETQLANM